MSTSPADGLPSITRGPDGNIWFVELFNSSPASVSKLARITPSGTITEFALPGSGLYGTLAIASGPDGNLWMVGASTNGSWIRRVTLTGAVTDFPLAAGAAPNAITTGPDGNIWFTESAQNKIGRITPTGQLTEFATPTAGRRSSGITSGPDGNLWFTEYGFNNGAIARITPVGVVTEYPLPPNDLKIGCGDSVMAAGPDGNIWFTSPDGDGIGRFTPAGVLVGFTASGGGCPRGLAAGPDGSIWFTGRPGVGRINPAGAIRQFGMPSPHTGTVAIAAGADGRMWFTESGVARVASIGVTVPEASLGSAVLNFGRPAGSTNLTVTVTNSGDASLHVVSATISGPDAAAFAKSSDACSGRALAIGATCLVAIQFKPSVGSGIRAARVQLVDDATGSPHAVSLVAELPDCRLPLVDHPSVQDQHQGKFLSVATGDVTVDPAGGFTWVPDQQVNRSVNEPVLSGAASNFSYDWPLSRWVPVASEAVSPDGSRYAYSGYNSAFHVVDVATGWDRVLPGVFGNVMAFSREGIYVANFSHAGYVTDPSQAGALALVDPDTGLTRTILHDNGIQAVADGAAWIGVVDPADPAPFQAGIGSRGYNEISRRDLATGAVTRWFYRPGTDVQVAAAVAGRLVLRTETPTAQDVWVVSGPDQADRLTVGTAGDPFQFDGYVSGDASVLWLAEPTGLYLWTLRTGLILISTDRSGSPVGTCS